jgi:hypothetical protein
MTSADVKALLAAAPQHDNTRTLTHADFSGVHFMDPVSFRSIRFEGMPV